MSGVLRRVGSLFSGIGGLELGLERVTNARTVWTCETAPFCRRVLARHWPEAEHLVDIREVKNVEPVDVLCGGFPCQNLSVFGDRTGLRGTESGLWSEFARVIRVAQPPFVFIENVTSLRTLLSDDGMGKVLADLAQAGYQVDWDCVPASAVGAPHMRDRVFILASRPETEAPVHPCPVEENGHDWPPLPSEESRDADVPAILPREHAEHSLERRARLRALGNAVVPQAAGLAWRTLLGRFDVTTPGVVFAILREGRWIEPCGSILAMLDIGGAVEGEEYLEAWPRAGSIREGRAAFLESGFKPPRKGERLWPTPAASMPNDGEEPGRWLRRFVEVASRETDAMRTGVPLSIAVRAPILLRVAKAAMLGEARALLERHARGSEKCLDSRDYVNPDWVELLMGFPKGWTASSGQTFPAVRS